MDVPVRLLTKWKLEKEHGDYEMISEYSKDFNPRKTPYDPRVISNVFKTGKGSISVIKAITAFYSRGKAELKKQAQEKLLQEMDVD